MTRGNLYIRATTQRATPARRTPVWVGLGIALLCIVAALGLLFLSMLGRQSATLPRVFVVDPETGDELVAGTPALVYGRAEDPDGIAGSELWVNGQLVGTQANPDGGNSFKLSQSWRPSQAGAYTLLVRATDTRGYSGQSATILIHVVEKIAPAADAVSEILPEEPGAAPALGPVADDSAPEDGASDDGSHPRVGIPDDVIPAGTPGRGFIPFRPLVGVVCSVAPVLCDGSASDATPRPDPEVCLFLTGTTDCAGPSRPGALPPAAPRITATYDSACGVGLTWTDESADELGFKVFRMKDEAEAVLIAMTGEGGTTFTDQPGTGGAYRYFAAAFNAQGESPGAPSAAVMVPAGDCASAGGESAYLDLEALTFTVEESLDRVYCYYSVGGAPFVRVPEDEAEFLEPVEGGWDIAEHAAGAHRLSIPHNAAEPLPVAGQCLGWHGLELVPLGGFSQSHAAEEWDDRTLTNSGGRFTVTYRIHPAVLESREGGSSAIIDPSLPAPYNLQFSRLDACRGGGMDPVTCALEDEAMLHWDWELMPGDMRTPAGFEVSYRLPTAFGRIGDAAVTRTYFFTLDKRAPGVFTQPCIINTANPLEPLDVGAQRIPDSDFYGSPALDYSLDGFVFAKDVYYSVKAFATSADGALHESPPSEEHWVGLIGCTQILVVQLSDLEFGINPDALDAFRPSENACEAEYRSSYDAADIYGWIEIAVDSYEDRIPGFRFWWNCPYCDDPGRMAGSGPTATRPPHDTGIGCDPGTLDWSGMALNVEGPDGSGTGYSRANNTIVLPMSGNADFVNLRVRYAFYDFDSGPFRQDDDLWCAADEVVQTQVGTPEGTGLHGFRVRTQRGEYITDYDIGCSVGIWTYSLPVSP